MLYICDGKVDCPQGSDELVCSCNKFNMVTCLYQSNAPICVPVTWACAGHSYCREFDHSYCSTLERNVTSPCAQEMMWCHFNNSCLPSRMVCDDKIDCFGGEDEANCAGTKHQILFCH